MRERGDEVEVTARDYAQTVQLLEQHGIEAELIGHHGGRSRVGKLATMVTRMSKLRRWARGRHFDAALAHGSHHLTLTARALGIPSSTTFDYEFATVQHQLGCRAATFVVVPDAIPPSGSSATASTRRSCGSTRGSRRSTTSRTSSLARKSSTELGVDLERILVVVRTPPDVSLYHRKSNPLFPQVLTFLGRHENVHAVVLPRTDEQRDYVRGLELPSVIVPDGAVDAQSLIAFADLVVSAGGTMNREAAALGIPVYTTYGGRLGGVDEALIREGRLRPLTDPRALELVKRSGEGQRVRRDPARDARTADARLDCRAGTSTYRGGRHETSVACTGRRRDRAHGDSHSRGRPARPGRDRRPGHQPGRWLHVHDHLDGVYRFGHLDGERRDVPDAGGLRRERRLQRRRRDVAHLEPRADATAARRLSGRRGQMRRPGADRRRRRLGRLGLGLANRAREGRCHCPQARADHDRPSRQLCRARRRRGTRT